MSPCEDFVVWLMIYLCFIATAGLAVKVFQMWFEGKFDRFIKKKRFK